MFALRDRITKFWVRRRAASPLGACRRLSARDVSWDCNPPWDSAGFHPLPLSGEYSPRGYRRAHPQCLAVHTHAHWAYTFIYFGIGRRILLSVSAFHCRCVVCAWCVPALRVPLVHSQINHFRQRMERVTTRRRRAHSGGASGRAHPVAVAQRALEEICPSDCVYFFHVAQKCLGFIKKLWTGVSHTCAAMRHETSSHVAGRLRRYGPL